MLQRLRDDGDPQEQKETGEILMTALAKARESNREPDAKGNDPMIQTIERKRTLRERHPELFPTPEETKARNKDAIAVLQRFVDEGDGQEQRETCDLLMKALAESRESNREPETK